MADKLADIVARMFGSLGMQDGAAAVRALDAHFSSQIPDEHQRMEQVEQCLRHLVMLQEKLGGWHALHTVLEAIVQQKTAIDPATLKAKLDRPVSVLAMSVRTTNVLENAGICYIGQLVQRTAAEMLKSTNCGQKSLKEIKAILADMGFKLGMDVPGWTRPTS